MNKIRTVMYGVLWVFVVSLGALVLAAILRMYAESTIVDVERNLRYTTSFYEANPQYRRITNFAGLVFIGGLVGYVTSIGAIGLALAHDVVQRITGTRTYIAPVWSVWGVWLGVLGAVFSTVMISGVSRLMGGGIVYVGFLNSLFERVSIEWMEIIPYGFLILSGISGVVALVQYPRFRSKNPSEPT